MTANNEAIKPAQIDAPQIGLRSIRDIISDLSKPVNPQRLKVRVEQRRNKRDNTTTKVELTYLPWYQAVRILDHYAPGWSYEVRNVQAIGANCVVTVRISIPCAEGVVYREATGIESLDVASFGDPVSNASSMALRRAAAHFGLALNLYDK
jgi:hypothetical protein